MLRTTQEAAGDSAARGTRQVAAGVICALPAELGALRQAVVGRVACSGAEVLEIEAEGQHIDAVVCGIGKVFAARAASVLLGRGAPRLLVVGTCGGLKRGLGPGTLVHCTRAAQTDLAVREGRETDSDATLREAWQAVAPGSAGWFLTADRPVLSLWRRLRLARAFSGDCVADMETAAVAALAGGAGVPWAALRAVTDRATWLGSASFQHHYPVQAGRAADTIPALLRCLVSPRPASGAAAAVPPSS